MTKMNKQLNMPAITSIMREFEKQNERMEMTQEAMGDAIDDAFEGDDEEEETEELVSQVLDEIGVNLDSELVSAPHAKIAGKEQEVVATKREEAMAVGEAAGPGPGGDAGGNSDIDTDLQARLDSLRKM